MRIPMRSIKKHLLLLFLGTAIFLSAFNLSAQGSDPSPEKGPHSSPFACTSFAVYSEETLYGMNFDYPEVEIRFTISSSGNLQVFQMEFMQEGSFVPTVGMNSAGLFSSCQMLYPEVNGGGQASSNEVYTWQVYRESLANFRVVEEVAEFISDKRVVHWSLTLHDLIADKYGDAMVVEAGAEANVITRIEGDFIVMTNFPNGEFVGKSYQDVEGAGAKRYKAAYEHILDTKAAFDVDLALEALEKAISTGEWGTLCSMVFDPEKGEVFIALKRDFDQIWRVSLEDRTIEGYRGVRKGANMALDTLGVKGSELEELAAFSMIRWEYIVGCVALLAAVVVAFALRNRQRA